MYLQKERSNFFRESIHGIGITFGRSVLDGINQVPQRNLASVCSIGRVFVVMMR
ncbi:hypothetical protein GBAR_LOCUS15496 [Geodia barretti]|uniref:Uncharacterized protein n=1 Tax=Geodia barretti TaxID=519541 RepID=A0AA35SDW2_GEOBA|nr:hypothetical protein GBAR_LOCUS15496 [Geodia barretti]